MTGHVDLPPDEDWWEHRLREKEKGTEHARLLAQEYGLLTLKDARVLADPAARRDGTAAEWPRPNTVSGAFEEADPEYAALAAPAHEFALAVVQRRDLPVAYESLADAALAVVAHLVGGHEIGYDDHSLCGNIVKCRWALVECRSCEESLAYVVTRMRRPEYAGLLDRCRALCGAIEERVDQLRQRVWW